MFDWLGDIFDGGTWDSISSGLGDVAKFGKDYSPYIQGGLGLLNGIDSMNRSRNYSQQQGATANQLADLFSPNSPYAQQLRQQLDRRDAAAGRRSQYGTRETELAAQLAKQQASTLGSSQYNNYLAGANRSPYGGLMGSLGQMFSFKDKNGNFKTPPGTSKALNYLTDSLFGSAPDVSIAGLGGAQSALGAQAGIPDAGTYSLLGGTDAQLPGYTQSGGPQGEGIFSGYGSSTAGNLSAAEGLGGAGSALTGGLGSGALGGTVGGADTLGGILGGTGFLPSYGAAAEGAGLGAGTAGAGGLFGEGAAGAGAAGAGAGGEAGMAGLGGLGPGLVALPFALAIGGMLNGIFGKSDGPPVSPRDRANMMAQDASGWYFDGTPLYQTLGSYDWLNPETQNYWDKQQTLATGQRGGMDLEHNYYQYDNGPLAAYMKSQYGNPTGDVSKGLGGYSNDQYGQAYDYFQNQNMQFNNYNPYLGWSSPGWNSNGGG